MSIEKYEVNGYQVTIHQDEHAESPDKWGNTDCFLVYDHRNFTVKVQGFDPEEIFEHVNRRKVNFYDGYFVFPVYAYIHSGVALSLGRSGWPFNCQWDTSFRGFALVKRQKGWTYTRKKAYKIAQSVVDEWNTYLSGDVYGYQVKDKDGALIDSCWGFYGMEAVKEEANAVVAYAIAEAFKARISKVKTFIRNRVPLEVRRERLNAN